MKDIRNFMNEKFEENSEINETKIDPNDEQELIDWVWKWEKVVGRDRVISDLDWVLKVYKKDKLPYSDKN